MSLLLEYKVNIEAKDKEGRTALYLAVKVKFTVGVKILITKGSKVNIWYNYVS